MPQNDTVTGLGDGQRRTGILVAAGLMLLVFGFTVALTWPPYVNRANPFWFIGMLVIFAAALSLIAVVFRWLDLASRDEAFALPTGSVRTLLAIGVMVLFAVFGLEAVSVSDGAFMQRWSEQPIGTALAPANASALDAEVKRYERQGVAVVVDKIDGANATLKLYRIERVKPAETSDMQKQVLTALVTLLTSVVSFYFGSRSVEAARDAKDKRDDAASNAGAQATLDADVAGLDTAIADGNRRLAALQSETALPGNEAALAGILAQTGPEAQAMVDDRTQLDALLADLRAGRVDQTAVSTALAALRKRVDALTQRLAEAEALVAKG